MSTTEKVVEELFSTFHDFIYRDLIYVVGGVAVIAAFFFAFDRLDNLCYADTTTTFFIILVGYVVGYAMQEAMSIVGVVRTSYKAPGRLIRYLGRRYAPADPWDSLPSTNKIDSLALKLCVDQHMPTETKKRHQRTINLKQLCSTMGSAGLVSALIGFVHAIIKSSEIFTWLLFAGILLVSVSLIVMNGIKHAQQRMLEFEVNRQCQECKGSALAMPNKYLL